MNKYDHIYAYLAECASRPFQWGVHDCCLFVCDWVNLRLGRDLAREFRGGYTTAIGARRLIDQRGGLETIIADAIANTPIELINPRMAERGDAALCEDSPHGPALGLCIGRQSAFLGIESGFLFLEMTTISKTWRIP